VAASGVLAALLASGVSLSIGLWVGRALRTRRVAAEQIRRAKHEARAIIARGRDDGRSLRLRSEIAQREEARVETKRVARSLSEARQGLEAEELALVDAESLCDLSLRQLRLEDQRLTQREKHLSKLESRTRPLLKSIHSLENELRQTLESAAGVSMQEIRDALGERLLERTKALVSRHKLDEEAAESGPSQPRRAKRIMGIAVGRYKGHYLTERTHATVPLGKGRAAVVAAVLGQIQQETGITLSLCEDRRSVRLEGLDGVARAVARRVLLQWRRSATSSESPTRLSTLLQQQRQQVDGEIRRLGRKAFAALKIPLAHREIVELVGRLNFRTSFTQNQWKHAVEVASLCGMMAEELGLDPLTARRAALLHDIGKSLTHELSGSHAVIGADYARRLGESEIVANAIGAHHAEESFGSPYAPLVAAADALSGARPGARRHTVDNFSAKVADLERIARSFSNVREAFAVHGGREIRVHVHEKRVDDVAAIELSRRIAHRITDEIVFPGQIRVTVIRQFIAEQSAG